MNLKEYSKGALLTESRIDAARVKDYEQFEGIVDVIINACTLLDLYKKNIYYGKPIDKVKWDLAVSEMRAASMLVEQHTFIEPVTPYWSSALTLDPRIVHGVIGITTEASELLEAIRPHLRTGDTTETVDAVNLGEEVGDISWYVAILLDSINQDWDEILTKNAAKLEKRNKGKKFDADATINRDVEAERKILES